MTKRFFWFVLVAVALMVAVGLFGCSRRSMPPVVVTQTSLQSDSLVRSLFTLFVADRLETSSDSFVSKERYIEKATVNENGDTLRLDTHTEISTSQYHALQRENRLLRARIDSLEHSKNRVDTVPVPYEVRVPYPVERKLTKWEKVKMDFGGFAIGGLCASAVVIALSAWLARKRRK